MGNLNDATNSAFDALQAFLHDMDGVDHISDKDAERIKEIWSRRKRPLIDLRFSDVNIMDTCVQCTEDCVIRIWDRDFEARHLADLNRAIISAAREKDATWPYGY